MINDHIDCCLCLSVVQIEAEENIQDDIELIETSPRVPLQPVPFDVATYPNWKIGRAHV